MSMASSRNASAIVWLFGMLVALDTATQLAFKWGAVALENMDFGWRMMATALSSPAVWLAILGYTATFVVWMRILQRAPLSLAFPVTGLAYVSVPACSAIVFGERIGLARALGIAIIVAGVALLATEPQEKQK